MLRRNISLNETMYSSPAEGEGTKTANALTRTRPKRKVCNAIDRHEIDCGDCDGDIYDNMSLSAAASFHKSSEITPSSNYSNFYPDDSFTTIISKFSDRNDSIQMLLSQKATRTNSAMTLYMDDGSTCCSTTCLDDSMASLTLYHNSLGDSTFTTSLVQSELYRQCINGSRRRRRQLMWPQQQHERKWGSPSSGAVRPMILNSVKPASMSVKALPRELELSAEEEG